MKLSIGESEFFSSVRAGDVLSIKQALRQEPYLVKFQDETGKTPLWLSVENGLPEMIKTLIAHGASTNVTDQDGNSLIHLAVNNSLNSDIGIPKILATTVDILLSSGISVNIANSKGFSCLHEAAVSGNKEMVLFLIERGADINQRNNEGFTPFLWSLCANVWERDVPKYLATLEVLVKSGADVNAITNNGETALDIARKWNSRPPFIKFLETHGVK
jgi:ankyrin repeat protein